MILAGIDEAGLGPTLGPLATASAALSVPDGETFASPWRLLSGAVTDKPGRHSRLPAVADSKLAYRAGGLAGLELTLGAFSRLAGRAAGPDISVSSLPGDPPPHPCYAGAWEEFPVRIGAAEIGLAAASLAAALSRAGLAVAHLEAALLFEPSLNRRFRDGLNKNQALLAETGRHLSRLAAKFPAEPLVVTIDKQGGRNDYLPFLSGLFPGAWLEELESGPKLSRYRLRRAGGDLDIGFQVKADRDAFAAALASQAAKYARERCMEALNRWFGRRRPGLRPTTGYPLDAKRWLAELGAAAGGEPWTDWLVRER